MNSRMSSLSQPVRKIDVLCKRVLTSTPHVASPELAQHKAATTPACLGASPVIERELTSSPVKACFIQDSTAIKRECLPAQSVQGEVSSRREHAHLRCQHTAPRHSPGRERDLGTAVCLLSVQGTAPPTAAAMSHQGLCAFFSILYNGTFTETSSF